MTPIHHRSGRDFALELVRRAVRIRMRTAILVSLPAILVSVWYGWRVHSTLTGYGAATESPQPARLDDYQLVLHDALRRDFRVLSMGNDTPSEKLMRIDLELSRTNRAKLLSSAEAGNREFVRLTVIDGSERGTGEVQLRGNEPWHVVGASRSMRIRLDEGHLHRDTRVFNLLNDPSPFVVGEHVILEIAAELEVLAPRSSFAQVSMNGQDLGLFRYQTQPDEGLLRMASRIPGNIYAGDLKPGTNENLWTDPSVWKRHAARAPTDDRRDLARLLRMVSTATVDQFAEFAKAELNLEAFARFEAIDIAFGSEQRDFRRNHRLYYDPYRGRWEPVAWSYRAFKHTPHFELVENPLTMRLKQVPGYCTILARTLFHLLVHEGSVEAVRKRAFRTLEDIAPALSADRDWYAHKLLPRLDDFHRRMLRPMTIERTALVLASEIETYAERHAFLVGELTQPPLAATLAPETEATNDSYRRRLRLHLTGRAGVRIERLDIRPTCAQPIWSLSSNARPLLENARASHALLPTPVDIDPAFRITGRDDADDENGGVRLTSTAATHDLELVSSCPVESLTIIGKSLSTDSTFRVEARVEPSADQTPIKRLSGAEVPAFSVGEPAFVPPLRWSDEPREVRLGPGTVEVASTRVFTPEENVEIQAGTRLVMSDQASLIFMGRVRFLGTPEAPVEIRPRGSRWGGISLQGPSTAGSLLSYVNISGGTSATWRTVEFPATVNLHDTRDIVVLGCAMNTNAGERDMFHAAYVQGLTVRDTAITGAAVDALDLELTTALVSGLRAFDSGDDAIDLMSSEVEVRDTALVRGAGNGISAGERAHVRAFGLLVSGFDVGVLAKNDSDVSLAQTLLYRNDAAVRAYRKESRFAGGSRITAEELFAVECGKEARLDRESKQSLRVTHLRAELPVDDSLASLRDSVLGIATWQALPGWVTQNGGGS